MDSKTKAFFSVVQALFYIFQPLLTIYRFLSSFLFIRAQPLSVFEVIKRNFRTNSVYQVSMAIEVMSGMGLKRFKNWIQIYLFRIHLCGVNARAPQIPWLVLIKCEKVWEKSVYTHTRNIKFRLFYSLVFLSLLKWCCVLFSNSAAAALRISFAIHMVLNSKHSLLEVGRCIQRIWSS